MNDIATAGRTRHHLAPKLVITMTHRQRRSVSF